MANEYTMESRVSVSDVAVSMVTKYFHTLGYVVQNVENDPAYRSIDIDLVVYKKGSTVTYTVEVKGDTYSKTGNIFFETVSNKGKSTPGCLLYTEAQYVFYVFVDSGRTIIMRPADVKKWFLANQNDFKVRTVKTKVKSSHYETEGRLVPIKRLLSDVPSTQEIQLSKAENE